jgi:hypothetical protein
MAAYFVSLAPEKFERAAYRNEAAKKISDTGSQSGLSFDRQQCYDSRATRDRGLSEISGSPAFVCASSRHERSKPTVA